MECPKNELHRIKQISGFMIMRDREIYLEKTNISSNLDRKRKRFSNLLVINN